MNDGLQVPVSDRDHVRGLRTAPITLVEYGDFDCSHCAAAYPVVHELLRRYLSSLRFVFRHNPRRQGGSRSKLAAHAAEAAAAQGKFWSMHDLLFERGTVDTMDQLYTYAELVGLDLARFREDVQAPDTAQRVRDDEIGGLRSGVIGTPTFFINSRHFRDSPDLDTLAAAVGATLLLNTGTSL